MKQIELKNITNVIYYYYPNNTSPLRVSTRVKISSKDIDKNGNIKKSTLNKNPFIIEKLFYVNNWILDFEREKKHLPPIELIKRKLNGEVEEQFENDKTFLFFFENFYNFKDKLDKNLKKKSSLKDYKSFENSIKDFEKHFNTTLFIYDIDNKFLVDYENFMVNKREKKNINYITKGNLNSNTLIKRFNILKTFFNWLFDEGIISKIPKDFSKINQKKQKVYKPYLSIEEINNLYNCEFDTPHKNKVKDIFIFACHTGMRFSDFSTIGKGHFITKKGFTFVRKKAEKVSEEFLVPLTDTANNIRLKYNNNFKMTNQVFNRTLKEIVKESNLFNDDFQDDNKKKTFKRYEKITAHVARHSFITNLVNGNVSINYIMGMTGHKKLETLNIYIHNKEPENNYIVNNIFDNK